MRNLWVAVAICALCTILSPDPSNAARDKSGLLKASNLMGAKVQDTGGQNLGSIKDLVIDPIEGDIEYAVLDFGGFLGVGDKYFAVPWEAMKLSENQEYLILDLSKKVLKDAPGFSKDHWPDMSDREWLITMHEYYALPGPEDEDRATGKIKKGAHSK